MFDKFSEAARTVIFWARYEAGRLRFEDIDSPHLVLGFINVDAGSDYTSLEEVFVPEHPRGEIRKRREYQAATESFLNGQTAAALHSLFSSAGSRPEPMATHGDMPLSERAKRVLSDAFEFANEAHVTPLHLLWAMLGDEQGEVAATLAEHGITRERIENEIRRLTRG
jgi:ATP-dependent Clp protease ATP-binding subunit ClpC